MRSYLRVPLFSALFCSSLFAYTQQKGSPVAPSVPPASIARWPIAFEPNLGQAPAGDAYLTHAGAMQAGFSANGMTLHLPTSSGADAPLSIRLAGANPSARIEPSEKTSGESNYLLGDRSSAWKTHIPQYGRLTSREIYPGVDLTVYGNGGRIEHDFIVQPGADYHQIRMSYEGASHLALSTQGDLRITLAQGEVTVHAPHIYQPVEGSRREIAGRFVLSAKNEVAFQVNGADPSLPLILDPVLDYATYVANQILFVTSTAVDTAGNTYILGQALSSGFPVTPGAFQSTCKSCSPFNTANLFITKLNPAGTAQVYSTYLGGSGNDTPLKIALDPSGNAIVTGTTTSTDFPQKNPVTANTTGGGFVTSLAPDGASLNFSSVFGNSFGMFPYAVTTDASGNVYVAGIALSQGIPLTAGTLQAVVPSNNSPAAFLTKLTPAGAVVFGSIPGGVGSASLCCTVAGIALDAGGNIYLAGNTGSANPFGSKVPAWPTTPGAYQTSLFGSQDDAAPWVAKISPDASTLIYSTLVGGGIATGMVLTSDQQILMVGHYPDTGYPVTSDAFSSVVGQGFLSKISADGTQLSYSTYFSTPTADTGGDIAAVALDPSGNVWIAGKTAYNNNIPLVNPLQSSPGSDSYGSGSAFLTEFDPKMHQILFSTYFNGAQSDSRITGLAMDSQGRAHIVGDAENDLPTNPSVFLPTVNASNTYYNTNYEFGFAALVDPTVPGPGICFASTNAGQVLVGTSGQASVTITNCGNAPLNLSAIQLSSPVFSLTSPGACIGTLAASASCVVNTIFTPAVAGAAGASVTVTSNATVPVYSVSVGGTGSAPSLSLLTPSITFSQQVFGVPASANQSQVFITNKGNGNAQLTVSSSLTTITGDFSIVRNSCVNIYPNSSCVLILSFNPTALGTRTGVITLASNDPVHPTIAVPLSGNAIAQYPAPIITSLSVPATALGTTSLKLNINGTNFFPTSTVIIGGEVQPLTLWGPNTLGVTVDPTLLTVMGDVPVVVVNPSPGGQSNTVPLVVYRALPISAGSLVYSPATQLLYASIASSATTNANTILPINPVTGAVGTPIPVGNNPGKLAVSSDGAYLYVALNTDHTLQRINLSTSAIERTFPLPVDGLTGPTTIPYMKAVPGSPQSVVVALARPGSPGEAGAALYNDGGLVNFLANSYPNYTTIDSFAFTSDPSAFYAFPFNNGLPGKIGVSPTGLTVISSPGVVCCDQATGSLLAGDSSLLYTNSGEVWNPVTSTLVGTYTVSPTFTLFYELDVLPDTANQRTFILDQYYGYNGISGYNNILSFDQTTFKLAGQLPLPQVSSTTDLNRWGSDGFALRTNNGSQDQILILRSSLLHLATGGTPSLTSLSTASAQVGTAAMQLTITGSGFLPGTTALWNGSPLATVELTSTQLSALVPAGLLATSGTAQVTAANPGGGTSTPLTFTVNPLPASTITFSIAAHTYGDAPFAVLASSKSTGAITYSVVSGPASIAGSTLTLTGAGSVTVQASQAATTAYSATNQSATFTVTPAALIVTAANATRVFGAANPTFSAILTGTLNQDVLVPSATSVATASSLVGTYPIVPSVTGAGLPNYTVTPVNGALTISQAGTTTALSSSSTSLVAGTSVTLTATLASATTGTPTGNVQFFNGTTVLGTATLSSGTAALTTSSLPQGIASLTAVYAGDTNFSGSQSVPLAIPVTAPPAPTLAFTVASHSYGDAPFAVLATSNSTGTITYSVVSGPATISGSTLTVTAAGNVTVQAAQAAATGYAAATQNVTFTVTPAALTVTAANATRAFGAANPAFSATITGTRNQDALTASATTSATTASPVGSYPIVPAVSGASLSNYTVTPVNGALTVTQASTTATVSSSASSAPVGASVTFTATIASNTSGTPTGTVQFFNGTTVLGTGTLASGTASFATTSLPQGTASVTAVYAGDTNFTGSTSSALIVTITGVPGYSIVASPSSLTIKQGQTGTTTLTVTPVNGFNQAVSFSCGTLPAGVTCAFAPASVTPGGSPVSTVLTVTTTAPHAQLHLPGGSAPFSLAFTFALTSLAALRRRRRSLRLLVFLGALVLPILSGCGGGTTSTSSTTTAGTPVGSSQITIVNSSSSGATSSNFSLSITITN